MNATLPESPHVLEPLRWNDSHREYLFNTALGRVRNRAIAEDLVQETFLSAWKAREKFQGKAAERTWLTRILLNKIADHYRRNARKPSVAISQFTEDQTEVEALDALFLANAADNDEASPLPSVNAQRNEFLLHLEEALDRIPAQAAAAFRMREIQGLSTEDIVAQLSITPNHLWVLIHRAKKSLRKELEHAWGENETPILAIHPFEMHSLS